jgi:hypothetical protein
MGSLKGPRAFEGNLLTFTERTDPRRAQPCKRARFASRIGCIFLSTLWGHRPYRGGGFAFFGVILMDNILEHSKIEAEIAKLMAETAKINKEATWYPIVVASGLIAAVVAITKLFL